MTDGVSIIIPSYNGGKLFAHCLEGIARQDYTGNQELIVIDSGSTDDSVETAARFGATVSCIPTSTFHHARTRNTALQQAHFNKVVYTVQDAIPESPQWLDRMCTAIDEHNVAAVSVRQLPHFDADISARFETELHAEYLGDKPLRKCVESANAFARLPYHDALHRVRHDNVCAIYKKEILQRYPFPDIEFAEDMAWAHVVLLNGHAILYDPSITIRHSHNRSPDYRFRRSIVESIACAKILGRVQNDISALPVADILDIQRALSNYAEELKRRTNFIPDNAWPSCPDNPIRAAVPHRVVALIKKAHNLVMSRLFKHNRTAVLFFQKRYTAHIAYTVSLIADRYPIPSAVELSNCVDQITATTLGRIYGEYYASFMLKGDVPDNVCNLVHPYLTGV
jgi:glycosyltransferase involved in cell wall biosynthesis